jgi:hypothetical protein
MLGWGGRIRSRSFLGAKWLILLTQKTRFTPQMYSELAQFFKAFFTGFEGQGQDVKQPLAASG